MRLLCACGQKRKFQKTRKTNRLYRAWSTATRALTLSAFRQKLERERQALEAMVGEFEYEDDNDERHQHQSEVTFSHGRPQYAQRQKENTTKYDRH